MAKSKLNMESTLKIRKVFWRRLSQYIKKWILKDMIKGEVQEYKSAGAKYYSKQYSKYKARYMNRIKQPGKKLKSVQGKSVRSNSSTANMYLTGELINGLHYYRSTDRVLELKYADKDKDKILGNPDRLITTLNETNLKRTKREYEGELNRNLKEWAKKKVYITAGK